MPSGMETSTILDLTADAREKSNRICLSECCHDEDRGDLGLDLAKLARGDASSDMQVNWMES